MASIYRRAKSHYVKCYDNGKRVRGSLGIGSRKEASRLREQIEHGFSSGSSDLKRKDMVPGRAPR